MTTDITRSKGKEKHTLSSENSIFAEAQCITAGP